jgi:hypothetical protein
LIPRTYPSTVDSNNIVRMTVFILSDVTGMTPWKDYIPVKNVASPTQLNSYGQNDAIAVNVLDNNTDLVPFRHYVPVYVDNSATDAWQVSSIGYIPCNPLVEPVQISSLSWDSVNDVYVTTESGPISTHLNMKRCLLLDNGTVNYYLDPTDSTLKATGGAADLTGADGQVMVEIPKFYTKREVSGNVTTWSISDKPVEGFVVHPAFIKDGVEVDKRYYSAYDACVFKASDSTIIETNNTDAQNTRVNTGTDKLISISGKYPMAGLTRNEFRLLADNRGSGWRQADWALFSTIQMLYLTEYGTFDSQTAIGLGNTRHTTWTAGGTFATNNRTCVSGLSNALGNGTGGSATGTINTSNNGDYMSYRGIENFFGNVWNWTDGVIVNPDGTASAGQGAWWFTNTRADFSDSVRTNMTNLMSTAPTAFGAAPYVNSIAAIDNFFIATGNTTGSATTFVTDAYYGSTTADRVVYGGGSATDGGLAGAFAVFSINAAAYRSRAVGARLAW